MNRCDVACKLRNQTQVFIWNLCTKVRKQIGSKQSAPEYVIDEMKQIFYPAKEEYKNSKMIVKISENF